MVRTDYILRSSNILNALLVALLVFLFFALVYPLLTVDRHVKIPALQGIEPKTEEPSNPEIVPNLLDYASVHEKNLFHPERKMPSEQKEQPVIVRPDVVFYGAVITHEKKIAYIEDRNNPFATPGRGKRQTPVTEGAMIGGYTLKVINPESILLIAGEDRMIVYLRDLKDRHPADSTLQSSVSPKGLHTPPPVSPQSRTSRPIPPPIPARPIVKK
ncbi:MAG: hypothetical protein HPY65_06645 [Syntrophaceae bacterium]|nr:hypothetical protein [Syntrophaceae bacterium]